MGHKLLYVIQSSDSVSVLTFAEAPIPLLAGIDRGSQRN